MTNDIWDIITITCGSGWLKGRLLITKNINWWPFLWGSSYISTYDRRVISELRWISYDFFSLVIDSQSLPLRYEIIESQIYPRPGNTWRELHSKKHLCKGQRFPTVVPSNHPHADQDQGGYRGYRNCDKDTYRNSCRSWPNNVFVTTPAQEIARF